MLKVQIHMVLTGSLQEVGLRIRNKSLFPSVTVAVWKGLSEGGVGTREERADT